VSDSAVKTFAVKRLYALIGLFVLASFALTGRAVQLQIMESDFLQGQGEARFLREVDLPTTRGVISDRNGEPLAVSTPVDSVWVNPKVLLQVPERIDELAETLNTDADAMERKLTQRASREFVWLKRRVHPALSEAITALDIPGVHLKKEYRRFYPAGEVAAHLIGFTNIDDIGQEGLELAYNEWLEGTPGSKRVIKDRKGRTVEEIEIVRKPEPGKDLSLTIDRRLQYLAYRELKRTVLEHGAASGSVVLLDSATGEVLAMANQPSYNPNQLTANSDGRRNRAVTDVFEPGSVMKPFAVLSLLENERVAPATPVDTNPGYLYLSGYTIKDHRNYGLLDVTGIITKSSNVGISKLVLELEPELMWDTYTRVGFGEATGTGFPGESAGVLRNHRRWRPVEQATISYGYGMSVTALQLAQAFAVLADEGRLRQPSLVMGAANPPISVTDPRLARQVVDMLETVPTVEGTGKQARVANYRVAGKTGTSRKASAAGYASRYIASFAGFAPASDPRLVVIAVVNDPSEGKFYGGDVAAPLFSNVMAGALRLMNIAPDDYEAAIARSEAAIARSEGEAP
jgi:cell division protein FtsI (penicillin-binding protein 3)